jgi:predicted dehydrogenase
MRVQSPEDILSLECIEAERGDYRRLAGGTMKDIVRIGVVGIGNMGGVHASYLDRGEVPGAELAAVCDIRQERLEWAKKELKISNPRVYGDFDELLRSGSTDALIIATSHYDHAALGVRAMEAGLHVLTEKPAGAHLAQALELEAAATLSGRVFGIMFNQRTYAHFAKLKDLVSSGELGRIKRSLWHLTISYRSQSYYDSGSWRASWAGEGGGVLLNQDSHQLDIWQWICGMPSRVRAFCRFGAYHDIEVEDDVVAYMEYPDGSTGVFVTSTGEAPGTNRLEISGDRGKLILDDDRLSFHRLRTPEREFNRTYTGGFGSPECWVSDIPTGGGGGEHVRITRNFVDAIRNNTPLIAPG